MLKGIDVSKWQGTIDWMKVKADGIDFAIIRAGYGSNSTAYDDKYYEKNVAGCEKVGIPYGVYLFSYANSVSDAISEADHVIRLVKGKKLSYPVFYDLEDAKTTGKCSNALILEIAKTFTERVEAAGYTVGIYANKNWNTTKLTDKWYDTKPRWIAQYNSKCTYTGKYDIWQYTSSGKVNGISGDVDMNYCYTDFVKATQPTEPSVNSQKPTSTPVSKPTNTPAYKPGQAIKLNQAPLYATSVTSKASTKKNGTFYIWSSEVINKRIRITNAASKAGKSGQVTGWIDVSSINSTSTATTTKPNSTTKPTAQPTSKTYKKGALVKLINKPLYTSSTSKKAATKKSGNYYIYDGKKVNGRYRITNKANRCGKTPAFLYVTGWIEL